MLNYFVDRPLLTMCLLLALTLGLLFKLHEKENEWKIYRDSHHCILTHGDPDVFIVDTSANASFIMVPGEELWSCYGGVIKERN